MRNTQLWQTCCGQCCSSDKLKTEKFDACDRVSTCTAHHDFMTYPRWMLCQKMCETKLNLVHLAFGSGQNRIRFSSDLLSLWAFSSDETWFAQHTGDLSPYTLHALKNQNHTSFIFGVEARQIPFEIAATKWIRRIGSLIKLGWFNKTHPFRFSFSVCRSSNSNVS